MVARAELNNVQLGLPLPGLGPAPSGGLTTNSRRTGTAPAFAAAQAEVPGTAKPSIFPTCLSGSPLPYVLRIVKTA